jgi:hypothetical protein
MFGWLSKKSRTPEAQVVGPEVGPAPATPASPPAAAVMREIPSRPMTPPGAAANGTSPRNNAAREAPPAPDHLVEWLAHATPDTRVAAARELGRRDDRRAVEPLVQALHDVHAPVRIAVANALGKLRDERAIDALAIVLADDEENVRGAARGALEAIGTTLAHAVLAEDDRWRRPPPPAAAEAEPKSSESDGGMAWLIKGVQSDDPAVHAPAMTALTEAGPAAVEPLIALLRDEHVWTRKRAAELLGRIGDTRAAGPLTKAIEAITPEDRSYESYALREALRAALASVNPPVPVEAPAPTESPAPAEQNISIERHARIEHSMPVEAPVQAPPPAEPPLAASRIELPLSASEPPSSAKPQAESRETSPSATFVPGITDATDQQLGERLREIAQAALGGGRPPLDSFDARRDAARAIGFELHRRGGRAAMERALDEYVGTSFGRHPISQAWDGVGEWMG